MQVLETRSDAIDSSIPAFEILKTGWVLVGAREEVFVIAIGSSCCGDTSEADLKKGWLWGSKRQPLGLPFELPAFIS